eukprot:1149513-Pelagomonas_calceolata.AAC.2
MGSMGLWLALISQFKYPVRVLTAAVLLLLLLLLKAHLTISMQCQAIQKLHCAEYTHTGPHACNINQAVTWRTPHWCAHPQPLHLIGTTFALKCSWHYKLPEHDPKPPKVTQFGTVGGQIACFTINRWMLRLKCPRWGEPMQRSMQEVAILGPQIAPSAALLAAPYAWALASLAWSAKGCGVGVTGLSLA